MFTRLTPLIAAFSVLAALAHAGDLRASGGKRWYKGNTHTHTLWSDGDAAPEVVVAWYKEHGYDFLCLSDHNIFQEGDFWFPVVEGTRLTQERVDAIRRQFGEAWVQLETKGERTAMRLKTLDELKAHFEAPEAFLLIPAEEVTSPVVHINVVNNRGLIVEAKGGPDKTKRDLLRENLDAIEAHGKAMGVPVLAHINHPNWNDGISAEDMIAVGGERFFEVYNGHAGVKNWGDARQYKQPTDRLWDIILAMRIREGAENPMYGMATDDSHDYFVWRVGECNSGRGWVQVLAEALSADALVGALKRGDFYASSGVTLNRIQSDERMLAIHIAAEAGVNYATQFIGTRKGFNAESQPVLDAAGQPIPWATRIYSDEIGKVLHETTENPARYTFKGDELYVRAKIVSSKLQPNPFAEGDHETAWTQPVRVAR